MTALLLFATRREEAWLRGARRTSSPGTGYAIIGMGPARAAAWAERFFADGCRADLVLSVGLCGGLRTGLAVGDVLLPAAVLGPDGRRWLCAGLLGPANGLLVTTDRAVADPAEKRALGLRTGADAVDMEAAAVAEACHSAGVPFAAVKAVSDPVDTALPSELAHVCPDGLVRFGRLLAAGVQRPGLVGELWRLGRASAAAMGRLARHIDDWLPTAGVSPRPPRSPASAGRPSPSSPACRRWRP